MCVCARVEISDLHMGWQIPRALEEAGGLETGVAQRHSAECGDRAGAEGRGELSGCSGKAFHARQVIPIADIE